MQALKLREQYATARHDAERLVAENTELRSIITAAAQQQAAAADAGMQRSTSPRARLQALAHSQDGSAAVHFVTVRYHFRELCSGVPRKLELSMRSEFRASLSIYTTIAPLQGSHTLLHPWGSSSCIEVQSDADDELYMISSAWRIDRQCCVLWDASLGVLCSQTAHLRPAHIDADSPKFYYINSHD